MSRQYKRQGYLDNPYYPPRKLFGSREYVVRRDGSKNIGGTILSHSARTMRRHREGNERAREQSEMECEVCRDECGFGFFTLSDDYESGPYFRERWRAFFILGICISKEYIETEEAYCRRHRPRDWEEEQ